MDLPKQGCHDQSQQAYKLQFLTDVSLLLNFSSTMKPLLLDWLITSFAQLCILPSKFLHKNCLDLTTPTKLVLITRLGSGYKNNETLGLPLLEVCTRNFKQQEQNTLRIHFEASTKICEPYHPLHHKYLWHLESRHCVHRGCLGY